MDIPVDLPADSTENLIYIPPVPVTEDLPRVLDGLDDISEDNASMVLSTISTNTESAEPDSGHSQITDMDLMIEADSPLGVNP
ncbi:hypothetical protein MFLAVUS_011226 [Mucor flavus]|uniref:Uncharacterized protein n=1 Tax=Mucor flavus TaxID=439312 RepID=A0ABP9ZEX8_9FUNG